jgi:copper chaperone CopZ/uncharacterized membrane protein YphA (DoxX/SURF4 family)
MEQRLVVMGMTCTGCQKTVTEKINALPGVEEVSVTLESGLTVIQSKRVLSEKEVSAALGSKYSVQNQNTIQVGEQGPSKFKQLTPLFLIFTYLIAGTFFLSYQLEASPQKAMLLFMGLFFIVFSFFKFLDYQGFPDSFRRYDPLAKKIPGYAQIYPFLETALGIAFLLEWQVSIALVVTLVILSFTTFGVLRSLLQKNTIQCACLGTALQLPMTEATLIENGIMLTMSSILLMGYIG